MSDCIFCKIIAGEIPSTKVYEDDFAIAFLDIQPVNIGHVLVLPKAHAADFSSTPDDVLAKLFPLIKKIAVAAMSATQADGYNIGINTGTAAGQVVMHTHVHVMPRFQNDGLKHWPKREVPAEDSAKAAEKMRMLLA